KLPLLKLTLINLNNPPPHFLQFNCINFVQLFVAVYLVQPPFRPAFWHYKVPATRMTMPETAVDKNNRLIFAEYDVRLPREVITVKPESETIGEQYFTNKKLGLRVLRPNPAHIVAANLCGMYV